MSNNNNNTNINTNNATNSSNNSNNTGRSTTRAGRGRNRQGNRNAGGNTQSTFIGREPLLKYDVFDYVDSHQAKKYRDNIEALKIYVGKHYPKYTAALVSSLDSLSLEVPEEFPMLDEKEATTTKLKKWEMDYKKREEKCDIYNNFLASFYALLWGQCTMVLRDKLCGHASFATIET